MTASPQPDFLRPARGPHPLAWAACAASLVVLAVALLDAWQARSALTQVQALASRRAQPPARPASAPESAQARATREALVRLGRPWPAVVASVESVQVGGVAWLALEVTETGALRLDGQVPEMNGALAAAQALREDTRWRQVLLDRVEMAAKDGQRFTLVATPAEGAW